MEVELTTILVQIKVLREYIVKLGPSRRQGKNFDAKISEVKALYKKFRTIISCQHKFSEELTKLVQNIESLYQSTIKFEQENTTLAKMESGSFCLKTAVSLLPKMNGDERVTQDLIDAIGLYSSMLRDTDRILLIRFVVSTRLSAGAKMRLGSDYDSVDRLLSDMKKHLLSVKSDGAIQAKLARVKQYDRSISDFGVEIEKLMTDLTISQAGESQEAYKVLQPLNEKYAVKRFADGLRDQRLGTIIAAQKITTLKDAIRVAEDESCTLGAQINSFQRQFKPKAYFGNDRSRGYSHVSYGVRNNFAHSTRSPRTYHKQNSMHVSYNNNNTRGRAVGLNNTYRSKPSQQNRRHVACIERTSADSMSSSRSSNAEQINKFFRG